MGGTFDPIHNGHLVAGSEVADLFDLDMVIFVPTGQPWQKKDTGVTEAEDRYLMTVIATASNPRFTVSRVDIDRPGNTYTVDTLTDIQQRYPAAELFFITGADALDRIVTWRDWEDVFQLAHFVGVTRPGYDLADAGETLRNQVDEDRLSLVNIPAMAISSTDIRQRGATGRPVWYLVPDGVVQYINKTGIYLRAADGDGTDGADGADGGGGSGTGTDRDGAGNPGTDRDGAGVHRGNPDAEPDVDWSDDRFPRGWF
ncbi:MAG TPA: nicotinate-nucleotide adenylyltransferase [Corynebacterium nuruki]|uniref:Probable nicotinate-nucleotide adenylyltransferase n=1 Tax=Corynebacterium nuruki TaxID=1032851 RepID=A0A3D4SWM0_9CORY|nr:nicotinate-nucleotide adenylyltransferase [Corynebacterium nuruki]